MSIFSCGRGQSDDREELDCHLVGKVVVVGDGAVGKTSLLLRFVNNEFDERYQPTIFENQAAPVFLKKRKIMLSLFDTAGQEGYEHLRPFMYPDSDVILICFSVDSHSSLRNVSNLWLPEVRAHLAKVPILLLGLKSDLRSTFFEPSVPSNLPEASRFSESPASPSPRRPVSYDEGQKVALEIGAKAYFECSAKINQGLTSIFQETARLVLKRHRRTRSIRSFLPL